MTWKIRNSRQVVAKTKILALKLSQNSKGCTVNTHCWDARSSVGKLVSAAAAIGRFGCALRGLLGLDNAKGSGDAAECVERLVEGQEHDNERANPAPHERDAGPQLEGGLAEHAHRHEEGGPRGDEEDGQANRPLEDPLLGRAQRLGRALDVLVVAKHLGVLAAIAADELHLLQDVPVKVHRLDDAADGADEARRAERDAAAS